MIDPTLSLLVSPKKDARPSVFGAKTSSVSSVCFVGGCDRRSSLNNRVEDKDDDGSSSSDEDEYPLRTSQLVQNETRRLDATVSARQASAANLTGRFVATCHLDGTCSLWDLGKRTIIQPFAKNRGPGLLLRRVCDREADSHVIYQTRNIEGTVSLHDASIFDDCSGVRTLDSFDTHSRSFCGASPCRGNPNILAVPSEVTEQASILDWRTSNRSCVTVRGAGQEVKDHGMLSSLAFLQRKDEGSSVVLACGMESGTVFLHDLRMPDKEVTAVSQETSINLSKDPVLSMDTAASGSVHGGMVVLAGLAGSAVDLSEAAPEDRGTVALLKYRCDENGERTIRLRSRLQTCSIPEGHSLISGRPGVSVCRFRPDGRIFAVGGWDHRLRIFDRALGGAPLAILKGHSSSVNAMDWASDSESSGLLATAAADGLLNIWRCFSRPKPAIAVGHYEGLVRNDHH